jgi:hypothetical protein
MEIDLLANQKDTDQRAFAECKFVRDSLPASELYQLIGQAGTRRVELAYLISTAELGKEARGAYLELKDDPAPGLPRLAFLGPSDLAEVMEEALGIPLCMRGSDGPTRQLATLIVSPEAPPFWVMEEQMGGIPEAAVIQMPEAASAADREVVSELLAGEPAYSGLRMRFSDPGNPPEAPTDRVPEMEGAVTQVAAAESLDDYRPCRPQDFVGRGKLQEDVWDYLLRVASGNSSTRILALSGRSGFGKSSVILKLADKSRNQRWRSRVFFYAVDARSARGPLYVAKVLRAALQAAADSGFVNAPSGGITIQSTEGLLRGASVETVLSELRDGNRIIVLFFDQLEELLTKSELLATFEAFRRLALEVQAASTNIVVGSSWRTGLALSDDNPAYHMWHGLSDSRMTFRLDRFTSRESSEMVTQFEHVLGGRLVDPLRRRLLEQGQGIPWLLKKLCIHVHREIGGGTSQEDLATRRLNVESLFQEDLEPLTDTQVACLTYVSNESPAEVSDVMERFGAETVNALIGGRLLTRAGQRCTVYWDVFRDYLVEGEVHAIPWTYAPVVPLSMTLKAFRLLQESGPRTVAELAEGLAYAASTAGNIVCDLQNMLIAQRDDAGRLSLNPELDDADLQGLAGFVRRQFEQHVVIASLFARVPSGGRIDTESVAALVWQSYSAVSLKAEAAKARANRLLPWLRFAGLLELDGHELVRPRDVGGEFGLVQGAGRGLVRGGPDFLCSSSPTRVIQLACRLGAAESLDDSLVRAEGYRNAAADLVGLGLAERDDSILVAGSALSVAASTGRERVIELVLEASKNSRTIAAASAISQRHPCTQALEFGRRVASRIKRNWSDASCVRHGNAARRWLRYIEQRETEGW